MKKKEKLNEGLGDHMFPKSPHCHKRGRGGGALPIASIFLEDLSTMKNVASGIWVKFLKVYIFPKYCHFFCNFDSCFLALFALVLLFQLFLWVNHLCRSRENQVFDPSPQVRYLKKPSKHGRF